MKIQDRYNAITSCEKMCHAGKAATSYYYSVFNETQQAIEKPLFSIGDILKCNSDLAATYIVRIYSEFEVTLRSYWEKGMGKRTRPCAEVLYDRVASRVYVRSDVLDNVHTVREYRNSLVHGGPATPVTLGEARKYLCTYISNLPREW